MVSLHQWRIDVDHHEKGPPGEKVDQIRRVEIPGHKIRAPMSRNMVKEFTRRSECQRESCTLCNSIWMGMIMRVLRYTMRVK